MPVSRGLIYAGGQKRGHAARFPIFNETLLLLLPLPPPPLLPSSSRGEVRRMRDSVPVLALEKSLLRQLLVVRERDGGAFRATENSERRDRTGVR